MFVYVRELSNNNIIPFFDAFCLLYDRAELLPFPSLSPNLIYTRNFEAPPRPPSNIGILNTSSNCAFENDLLKNKTKNSNNMHFCAPMHCDAMNSTL